MENIKEKICFSLNNKDIEVMADPSMRLIDLLRDVIGLTGTKEGCGEGECGACTVIIDGMTANSCLVLASQIRGRKVLTIEGLENGDKLHPIQQAFIDVGAVQCGFCTPGMVLSAKALLDKKPEPDTQAIKTAISGNLCRCTGYKKIEKAIELAADYLKKDGEE
ncbi:MAG: (2Fe-2S)-binding protein [Bacillota bacterium]